MRRIWTRWAINFCGASVGSAALFLTSTGYGQELPAVPAVPAVEPVKDAVEPVKDAAEPVKDAAEPVKDAAEPVKDAAEPVKDAAKDGVDAATAPVKPATDAARDAARDATDTARDAARDATRDVREGARDATREAREGVRDVREGARDAVRDTREGVRDTARDARDTVRDVRDTARDTVRDVRGSVNASGSARANLQWQDLQSADLGLWFNRDTRDGLIISDIGTEGPIARLGFQEGDRIVSVGGQRITRQADFTRFLFSSNAQGRVPVIVFRDGREQTIYMEPQVFLTHANSYQSDPLERFGIILDDRVQDQVVVWRVMPRSPAFFAGIRGGDLIVSFNKQPIESSAQLGELAAKADTGPIAVEVQRGDRVRMVDLDLQASSNAEARTALRPGYEAPAMEPVRVAPASGYYNNSGNNSGRRGLFRWRR